MEGSEKITEIGLRRGTKGLGFNIRGGKDNPFLEEDNGIFVVKIRHDGAAAEDGRLQEGDKIIEINGKKLLDVEHNVAVKEFIEAGDAVTLKVVTGAERAILEKSAHKKKGSKSKLLAMTFLIGGIAAATGFIAFRYYKQK